MTRRDFLIRGTCLGAGVALGAVGVHTHTWSTQPGLTPVLGQDSNKNKAVDPEERLKALGLTLPNVTAPRATLAPAVLVGELLFVSGYGPGMIEGKAIVGKLGKDFTLQQGQDAARRVGLQILAVVRSELGSLRRVVRLVKTLGMVNATPEFTQQPQVINGFSDLMVEVFGERAGKGARSAVGMASLPGGIPVEVEAVFQVQR